LVTTLAMTARRSVIRS